MTRTEYVQDLAQRICEAPTHGDRIGVWIEIPADMREEVKREVQERERARRAQRS